MGMVGSACPSTANSIEKVRVKCLWVGLGHSNTGSKLSHVL